VTILVSCSESFSMTYHSYLAGDHMPKIVRFHELGGPEVLKVEDLPSREPGKGEVRLRVQAVGLNRAESMFFHGRYLEAPQLPARLGYEAAGVVDAVGPGVDKSWLGKRVSTIPSFSMNAYGVFGEEAIAPVAALGEYPAGLSAAEGAAIWMQYLTAYGALIELGRLKRDEFVVITAASSNVRIAAIDIAKAEGAIAIATTRTSAVTNFDHTGYRFVHAANRQHRIDACERLHSYDDFGKCVSLKSRCGDSDCVSARNEWQRG
jgi:NADPH:quinone reductase-like Zn-dependent oxidoreductase